MSCSFVHLIISNSRLKSIDKTINEVEHRPEFGLQLKFALYGRLNNGHYGVEQHDVVNLRILNFVSTLQFGLIE